MKYKGRRTEKTKTGKEKTFEREINICEQVDKKKGRAKQKQSEKK